MLAKEYLKRCKITLSDAACSQVYAIEEEIAKLIKMSSMSWEFGVSDKYDKALCISFAEGIVCSVAAAGIAYIGYRLITEHKKSTTKEES